MSALDLAWLAVAAGLFLRVLEYLENRSLYLDERLLLQNLVRLRVLDFHTVLSDDQLAPPGYLIVGRLLVRLPVEGQSVVRLFSLGCGALSVLLMRVAARLYLTRQAVPIAIGLFALCDWMLYYSAEIKQYGCDAMFALAALCLAAGPAAAWAPAPVAPARRQFLALAGFGVVGVWFSFPLALVLAGIGTYLIVAPALRKQWTQASRYLAVSLSWAASFAACFKVSHAILSKRQFIWDWWDFAFLPLPPHSLAELNRDFWQVVNLLNSPSDVVTPLGMLPSAFFSLGLFLFGTLALLRRWRGGLWLVISPLFFAIAASALHQYPFHGRLLLFLVPSVHLLVAEGAAGLARCAGALFVLALGGFTLDAPNITMLRRWAQGLCVLALGVFLLYRPAADVVWQHLVMKRARTFDTHGDLRPDLLDYFDALERKAKRS